MLSFNEIEELESACQQMDISRRIALACLTKSSEELKTLEPLVFENVSNCVNDFIVHLEDLLNLAKLAKERLN